MSWLQIKVRQNICISES